MNMPSGSPNPDWAYDEDSYCVCCGAGRWKYHYVHCSLADALWVFFAWNVTALFVGLDLEEE